ncbi:hypothetical protein C0Q70_12016 [Pomacea canaliculata]|uniref:SRCR domain-containing protein n=1 Tax=Pomacea canaliculata TaxID=400727 RepID=A0A2T7P0A9_POMCA|nr:hypothetical protein C0Q70_12016 [Pomacea canaliculata]
MEENENNSSVISNDTEQEGRTFEDLSGGSTSKMLVSPASVTEGSRALVQELLQQVDTEQELEEFCSMKSSVKVISLSSCNTSRKYLEVKEGRSDNEFTCTGLTAQEDVRWFFQNNISFCSPSPSLRSIKCLTRLTENRTSDTVSFATIDARENSDPNYIGTGTLTCQTATATISCPMDSVYPAENSSCQVQFEDNKVTAWCSVSKASQATLVGSYTMDVVPASSGYFSGMCNMTSYLPPEGRYSYYVIIMPGEVNVSATFIGSSIISRPIGTLYHNCPLYLNEGDTLNCSCFVNDLGNPPGVLRWNGTVSAKLEFKNLTKLQNGIQSVCSLTWNNTVYQSVSYTLLVDLAATTDEYGSGVGRIILDGVRCTGTEKSLLECNHKPLYQPECEDFQAGVICKETSTVSKPASATTTARPRRGKHQKNNHTKTGYTPIFSFVSLS